MIQAIVFDCFGVLATEGLLPFRLKYFGNEPETLEAVVTFGKRVDAGLASYDDFITYLAGAAHISEVSVRDQLEHNIPDKQLFAYIKTELKPHYKLGMLSNAGDNWLDEIFEPDQVQLFDAIALSYELGYIKPDPRAYHTIADRLGVRSEECIFVDDQKRYCDGARETGMQALYYQGLPTLKDELTKYLRH